MNQGQAKEILAILDLANEKGKFSIAFDNSPSMLETAIDQEWIRFINIEPVMDTPYFFKRVFKLTPTGEMQRNMARDALK